MKRFVSNSLFGSLSSLGATLGNLASSLIVARLLGVEGMGAVAFAVWIATTSVTVFGLGLPATLARYLPSLPDDDGQREGRIAAGYLSRRYLLAMAVPVGLLLTLAMWNGWMADRSPWPAGDSGLLRDPKFCVLVAMLCWAFALLELIRGYYRGRQLFHQLAVMTAVSALCQALFVTIGALCCGTGGVIAAYVAGTAVVACLDWRFVANVSGLSRPLKARLLRYARFRWAADINSTFVWSRIEIFFLQVSGGIGQVGLFTAGLTLVGLAVQAVQMLGWGLLPHFSQQFGSNRLDDMRSGFETVVRVMAMLTFPACLGLSAILPEVVPLLFGDRFADAVAASRILVIGAAVIGPGTVAVTIMWAMERSDIEFRSGLVGVGVAVIGGTILVPLFGVIGAAISRVATQLAFVVFCNAYLVRAFGYRVPVGDLVRILAAAAACAGAARACLTVWHGPSGLPAAIAGGMVTYGIALRLLKVVHSDDLARISRATAVLPVPVAAASRRALRFISAT